MIGIFQISNISHIFAKQIVRSVNGDPIKTIMHLPPTLKNPG